MKKENIAFSLIFGGIATMGYCMSCRPHEITPELLRYTEIVQTIDSSREVDILRDANIRNKLEVLLSEADSLDANSGGILSKQYRENDMPLVDRNGMPLVLSGLLEIALGAYLLPIGKKKEVLRYTQQ